MVEIAHRLRDILVPALLTASAGILLLLIAVIVHRLLRRAASAHDARIKRRYRPLVAAVVHEDGVARDTALAILGGSPRRHRHHIADALLEPLRIVQGSAVERARAAAEALGLLEIWRGQLTHGSWTTRAHAAQAVGLMRDRASVPDLVVLLDHAHDELRAAVVDALGAIGDVTAVEALLARVGQQTRHQQARLVEALRRIGPAVTVSIIEMGAREAGQRRLIAEVLAMVGGPAARGTLLEWTGDEEPVVRAAAWRAVGHIGLDDRASYYALRALSDPDARVRAHAALALGRTGRADAVPYLAAHLDDEWEVAAQGARALAALGAEGVAALEAREASGIGGHGAELARHFLWERRRP
jgi:HEAT repeat protein